MSDPNPFTVSNQMVDEILTSAMEGGSTYWTTEVRVIGGFPRVPSTLFPEAGDAVYASECLTKGRDLAWIDQDGTVFTLTLAAMKRGIRKAAAHFDLTPTEFYEEHDASDADVAVQFAILGQIVYG